MTSTITNNGVTAIWLEKASAAPVLYTPRSTHSATECLINAELDSGAGAIVTRAN